jgi:hypothetical protein
MFRSPTKLEPRRRIGKYRTSSSAPQTARRNSGLTNDSHEIDGTKLNGVPRHENPRALHRTHREEANCSLRCHLRELLHFFERLSASARRIEIGAELHAPLIETIDMRLGCARPHRIAPALRSRNRVGMGLDLLGQLSALAAVRLLNSRCRAGDQKRECERNHNKTHKCPLPSTLSWSPHFIDHFSAQVKPSSATRRHRTRFRSLYNSAARGRQPNAAPALHASHVPYVYINIEVVMDPEAPENNPVGSEGVDDLLARTMR